MPYIKETYITGAVTEVTKKFTYTYKGKTTKRNPKTQETPESQKKQNEGIAIKKLRRLINANFGYGDYHIVLDYELKYRPKTPQEAKENLEKFLRGARAVCKKQGKVFKYVATTEFGERAWHHHLVINCTDIAILSDVWEHGRQKLFPLDRTGQYKQLASYIIKQTRKTFNDPKRQVHKKRWCSSTNLIKPQPIIEIVKANSWREDPKPAKGYMIDERYSGINDITGYPYQFYNMVKIDAYKRGGRELSIKCIPGPTTRDYCLKCGKKGEKIDYKNPMVHMKCECGETWRTLSSHCEACKKPSETPDYVDCKYCKPKKKGGEKVEQSNHSRATNPRSRSTVYPNGKSGSFF